jgi:polysaccharide biosynthesis/export protein
MKSSNWKVLIFISLTLIGCTGPQRAVTTDPNQPIRPLAIDTTTDEYLLGVGDVIEVKFYYNSELNERVTIRPDGRISLQMVDEVKAAGLTPAQLNNILREKYSRTLKKPEVAVIVKEFSAQKIYVGGEVATPGVFPITTNTTVLQAIVSAGGLRETAEARNVIIVSKGPEGTPVTRTENLAVVLAGKSKVEESVLKSFDVVYVPKSQVAEADKFVAQYIRDMIPVNLSAGFSYTLYRGHQTGSINTTPVH